MITRYDCPLCDWYLVDTSGENLGDVAGPMAIEQALGVPPGTLVLRMELDHRAQVESQLNDHLSTHPLHEWVTEVQRLRSLLDARGPAYQHPQTRPGDPSLRADWCHPGREE